MARAQIPAGMRTRPRRALQVPFESPIDRRTWGAAGIVKAAPRDPIDIVQANVLQRQLPYHLMPTILLALPLLFGIRWLRFGWIKSLPLCEPICRWAIWAATRTTAIGFRRSCAATAMNSSISWAPATRCTSRIRPRCKLRATHGCRAKRFAQVGARPALRRGGTPGRVAPNPCSPASSRRRPGRVPASGSNRGRPPSRG